MTIPIGDGTNKGPTKKRVQKGMAATAEAVQAGVAAGGAFHAANQRHADASQKMKDDRSRQIGFLPGRAGAPEVPKGYRGGASKAK